MTNPWKKISEKILYSNKYGYSLREDKVVTPAGTIEDNQDPLENAKTNKLLDW